MDQAKQVRVRDLRKGAADRRKRADNAKKVEQAQAIRLTAEQLESEADDLTERDAQGGDRPLFKGGL